MLEAFAILIGALIVGRLAAPFADSERHPRVRRATAALETPWPVWIIGVATAVVVWTVWGHVHPTATVHDEASYLLQARTFARGRFANPAPPLPEFFEQFHVIVSPTFASKYPPGTGLLIVPGVWLGVPALAPVLLVGVSGAFLFLLARRVANAWVALVAWIVWLSAPRTLDNGAHYYSENVSQALWLVGWWLLLEWRETARRRWLLGLAACIGWIAITRQLTALTYAIPVAAVVLPRVARRRDWGALGAVALGILVLTLIPLSNRAITGDWRKMPWSEYGRDYVPFDHLGFGFDSTPPRRALTPDMQAFWRLVIPAARQHVPPMLPMIFARRGLWMLTDMFGGQRVVLFPFAILGLVAAGPAISLAVISMLLLMGAYLLYPHNANWTIYYVETQPTLAFLVARGLWGVAVLVTPHGHRPRLRDAHRTVTPGAAVAVASMILLTLPYVHTVTTFMRRVRRFDQSYQRSFFERVAALPEPRSIVFIRYAPAHPIYRSLIANEPDLASARAWLVYDRGDDNARLARLAPDRVPYVYDEAAGTLLRYPPMTSTR